MYDRLVMHQNQFNAEELKWDFESILFSKFDIFSSKTES